MKYWIVLSLLFSSVAFGRVDIEKLLKVNSSAPAMTLEAEELAYSSSNGKIKVVDDPAAGGGKWVLFERGKSGEWLEFGLKKLRAGYYHLSYQYSRTPHRGAVAVAVDGKVIGGFESQRSRKDEGFAKIPVGTFFHSESGPLKIRFKHIGATGGSNPGLSVDTLFADPAPVRDKDHAGITPARNKNFRVDAIAEARGHLRKSPVAGAAFSPFYALPEYNPNGKDIPVNALDCKNYPYVQDCVFDEGTVTSVPMVLFCHDGVMRNCTFKNWKWTGTHKQRRYMIHKYSGRKLMMYNLKFVNCGGNGSLIFREANAVTAAIDWSTVDFDNGSDVLFAGLNLSSGVRK